MRERERALYVMYRDFISLSYTSCKYDFLHTLNNMYAIHMCFYP